MSATSKSIAFVHHHLVLGGAERTSYDTAERLKSLHGIDAYFFAFSWDSKVRSPFDQDQSHLLLLPDKKELFSQENTSFFIEQIRKHHIGVIFIASPTLEAPIEIKEATGCKVCYWLHSMPFWEVINKVENARTRSSRSLGDWLLWHLIKKPQYLWRNRYLKRVQASYRKQIELLDAYICLCEQDKEILVQTLRLSSIEAERIIPLGNTLDINTNVDLQNKGKQIIYMGRLSRADKRVDRLLQIWHRVHTSLPEWELKIYGTGKEERVLKCMAGRLNLPRLDFCGYTSDIEQVHREASILCMTSTYEGFPLALAEAQNNGTIPIAFDCSGGIRFIIEEDGKYGRLIEPFDLDAYAQALVEVCTNDEMRRGIQERVLIKRHAYDRSVNDEPRARLLRELLPE